MTSIPTLYLGILKIYTFILKKKVLNLVSLKLYQTHKLKLLSVIYLILHIFKIPLHNKEKTVINVPILYFINSSKTFCKLVI